MGDDYTEYGKNTSEVTIGIVTRLAVERDSQRSYFITPEGEKWLCNALKFASLASIPSIQNLESKPNFWFILVDSTVSDELKQKIYDTFNQGTSVPIRLVLTNGWDDCSRALKSNPEANKCMIQVRLDYDDMLHKSFLSKMLFVSQSFGKRCCLISPSNGICRELEPRRFAQIRKVLPPFLALYRGNESSELAIFSYDHDKWPSELVYELRTIPLWVQTITGYNISNKFGRDWMVQSMKHLKTLNLEPWTGETMHLTTSMNCVRLRNIVEMIFDVVLRIRAFALKMQPLFVPLIASLYF